MKLHSELSVGLIVVYACLLASLSGSTSRETNLHKSVQENAGFLDSNYQTSDSSQVAETTPDAINDIEKQ